MRLLPIRVLRWIRIRSELLYRFLRYGRWNINTQGFWDRKYSRSTCFNENHQAFLHQEVLDRIPPGSRVLDLGCGVGVLLKKFRDAGHQPVGIDISLVAVEKCTEARFEAHIANLPSLPSLGGPPFSAVTCLETMEHVDDTTGLLAAAASVLETDGLYLCSVPNCESPDSSMSPAKFDEHVHAFDVESLRRALAFHFRSVEVFPLTDPTSSKIYLLGVGAAPLGKMTQGTRSPTRKESNGAYVIRPAAAVRSDQSGCRASR